MRRAEWSSVCGARKCWRPSGASVLRSRWAADPDRRQPAFGTVRRSAIWYSIHREHAEARLAETAAALRRGGGQVPSREALLAGFIEIADERMADAIRRISLQKGYDPVDYALVAFGGAGAQHACGVAARLGIGVVLVPVDAGLLSALGIGHAAIERFAEKQALQPLEILGDRLEEMVHEVEREALQMREEGVGEAAVRRRIVEMRFVGQDEPLAIDWCNDVEAAFVERYEALYGHRPVERQIEVVAVRAVAAIGAAREERPLQASEKSRRDPNVVRVFGLVIRG